MRGLDPRIHRASQGFQEMMDCRDKPGNDEVKKEHIRERQ
jgi:hypothetical protein